MDPITTDPDKLESLKLPDVHQDPYVSSMLQVRDCIKLAGKGPAKMMQDFLRETDASIAKAPQLPREQLKIATREAVRAILVWTLAGCSPRARHVYLPFETLIPHDTLGLPD